MAGRRLNVFSIPPGEPFLEVLAGRLLDGSIVPGFPAPGDPLALARATILLPTRRACRALQDVFLARAGGPLLLPRIRPIGEVEADELDLADIPEPFEPAPDLPEAIPPLERQLALTRLVLGALRAGAAGEGQTLAPATAGEAVHLATELARLMDAMATEGISWQGLKAIVPAELQRHWELTLEFLAIATRHWPDFLAARGLIEPAERRRLQMEAETERLARAPVRPVIAAGSTGSIPSTAALLEVIARMPQGAVVLPGLDRDLDEATWDLLARSGDAVPDPVPSHPQTALRQLLRRLDRLARDEVRVLTRSGAEDGAARARERLVAEAMRPAESTDVWAVSRLEPESVAGALADVALLEAANEQEEAVAIALALRETLETPGRTAALVTPDRTLARRVAAELGRFGVAVDDSSGRPLPDTPAGAFARLVAETCRDGFAPVTLLALLKHPLTGLGLDPAAVRRGARALERLALRGPLPAGGSAGLRQALAVEPVTRAGKSLSAVERSQALDLAERAIAMLGPLEAALSSGAETPLGALVALFTETLRSVASTHDGAEPLTRREDGRGLLAFLAECASAASIAPPIRPSEFPELAVALMRGRVVRRAAPTEPRLHIYGLLEARLIAHDRVVLGGLNEGTWPATTRTDPWLSRGMRADLTLPAPERRIGLSAHDFVAALGTKDAILTRALKAGGAPTVPSRWLQRLFAVAGTTAADALRGRGARLVALARTLDRHTGEVGPVACPEPRPPVAVRPNRLSVTRIETLIRDPYSIYARSILRLEPLEPIGEAPGAAERGTLIHDTLDAFAAAVAEGATLTEETLIALGRKRFAPLKAYPELHAFWWPRFCRIARWYVGFEARRQASGAAIVTEREGRLDIDLGGRNFMLTARADRIEWQMDGTFSVLDFKTGRVPAQKEVAVGFAPQLPLEAAMVARGAFADIPAGLTPAELTYVALKGTEPGGSEEPRLPREGTLPEFVDATYQETVRLLKRFEDERVGYRSLAASQRSLSYGDYDHLARVREWGLVGGGEE
jgi:ATP-dependent helicase/nuclease subunit B